MVVSHGPVGAGGVVVVQGVVVWQRQQKRLVHTPPGHTFEVCTAFAYHGAMHEKLAQVSCVVVVGAGVTVVGVGVVVVGVVVGVKQQSFIEHPCGPLQTTDAGLSTDAYGTGQGKLAQLYTLVAVRCPRPFLLQPPLPAQP